MMSGSSTNRVRQMFLWGFPLVVLAATWFYWPVVHGAGLAFPLYLLSVPFLFALVVIQTATRYLRLWCWNMSLAHLAFLWSTYPGLGILIVGDTMTAPFTGAALIKSVIFSALVSAVIGTLVDIVGIDEKLLVVYHALPNLGTVKTVLSYSFQFFGIFGALYGASAKVGYYVLVELGATRWLPVLILCGGVALCLPFMSYFLLFRKERPLQRPR
jgi:hypothetical protein